MWTRLWPILRYYPTIPGGAKENHEQFQSRKSVSQPWFERGTSRIHLGRVFLLVWWGVESNWAHSALRSLIGLLCQHRVIMMMEKSVEWWSAGETEVLGENLPQCRFVHHKPHMPARTRTRTAAVGSQRLTAWATARPLGRVTVPVSLLHLFVQEHLPAAEMEPQVADLFKFELTTRLSGIQRSRSMSQNSRHRTEYKTHKPKKKW
jgi:hypothetical protein